MKLQITIPKTEVQKYFTEIDRTICNSGIPDAVNISCNIISAAHRVALDAFELGKEFGRRNSDPQPGGETVSEENKDNTIVNLVDKVKKLMDYIDRELGVGTAEVDHPDVVETIRKIQPDYKSSEAPLDVSWLEGVNTWNNTKSQSEVKK